MAPTKEQSDEALHLADIFSENLTEEEIVSTSKNINLQSIRVHKYLTHTGMLGKVVTAKFLSSINLNENTKFYELEKTQIQSIIKYCKS